MRSAVGRVVECPRCGAPLAPARFARTAVCSFCHSTVQVDPHAVPAARFREARAAWNAPDTHGYADYWSIGESHWAPRRFVARGDTADVFCADRARRPTQRVLLKVLRETAAAPRFDREWEILEELQRSRAPGADHFVLLLPQPVVRGTIARGPHQGRPAMALRWASGFDRTLEEVRQAQPRGIDPQISIWMWRRILEILSFLHRSGIAHGAVLPPHLLVETGEHGMRLVGFGAAGAPGTAPAAVCRRFESFYPTRRTLAPDADVAMSARAMAYVLGGDGALPDVPASVPEPLAALVRELAAEGAGDAWEVRERVGEVGRRLYGPPSFRPLVLSS